MRAIPVLLLLASAAGCLSSSAPAAEGADAAALPEAADVAAAEVAPGPDDSPRALDVALDGRIRTYAFACALGPVGRCVGQGVGAPESDLLLEGETGRVAGGRLVLTWTPASPATERLSFGLMLMRGEGCDGVDLGMASGPSPLALEVDDAGRGLCPDEAVHAWVAGTTWDTVGPAYYQVDVEQDFRLEGTLLLSAS